MAVRHFDVTGSRAATFVPVAPAARPRRERRRARQRWLVVSTIAVALPFAAAVAVLGVAH